MKLVISNYILKCGLAHWDYRFRILNEVKNHGSSIILIDYYDRDINQVTQFPFKTTAQSLVKNRRLIQIICRYENGPKAILRIVRIRDIVKGNPHIGCAKRFWELTVIDPKKKYNVNLLNN